MSLPVTFVREFSAYQRNLANHFLGEDIVSRPRVNALTQVVDHLFPQYRGVKLPQENATALYRLKTCLVVAALGDPAHITDYNVKLPDELIIQSTKVADSVFEYWKSLHRMAGQVVSSDTLPMDEIKAAILTMDKSRITHLVGVEVEDRELVTAQQRIEERTGEDLRDTIIARRIAEARFADKVLRYERAAGRGRERE